MPLPPVPDAAVMLRAAAGSWRECIRFAGEALVEAGATRSAYTDAMIAMVEEHGPYIVIAPGLALAHARSGAAVLRDGLSVVTLETPVPFGHANNDPVRVVLGLALADLATHLETVGALANIFNDPTATERLANAHDADEVRAVMEVQAV